MGKYFRLIGIPFLVAVVIYLLIRFVMVPSFETPYITVDDYVLFLNSSKEGIVLVTEENAVNGDEFLKSLEQLLDGKKVKLYKLDMTNVTGDDKKRFIDINEFTGEEFIIPMVAYVKDGKLIDFISGYAPDYIIEQFINDNTIE